TPPLTLRLDDLYPDSYTFVRISDNNSGYETTLEGSQLILDGDRSRSEVILINDYGKVFPHDGEYTMELMTKTPFGTDLLHKISFPVNRTLRVRAMQTDFAASE